MRTELVRTPVTPTAKESKGNLVDLRVGNKPETFAKETHERKRWSDEGLQVELVDVECE